MLETAAVPALQVLRRADVPGPFLATASFAYGGYARLFAAEPEEREAPGFFTDGLYAVSPVLFDSGSAALLAVGERFRTRHGHEPSWRVVLAYDATRMLLGAWPPPCPAAARRRRRRATRRRADGRCARPSPRWTVPARAFAGLSGPIWFDAARGRPAAVRMARFDRDLLESAPLQLVPVANPDLAERVAGTVVPRRGGALRPLPAGGLRRHLPQRDLPGRPAAVELHRGLLPLAPQRRPAGRDRTRARSSSRTCAAATSIRRCRRSAATCRTARSTASGTCAASSATSSTCTASRSTGKPWRCACSTRAPPRTASSTRSTGARRRRLRRRRPAGRRRRAIPQARRRRPPVGQSRRVPRPDAVACAPGRGAAGRAGHPLRARRPAADRRRAGAGALGLPLRGGAAPADGRHARQEPAADRADDADDVRLALVPARPGAGQDSDGGHRRALGHRPARLHQQPARQRRLHHGRRVRLLRVLRARAALHPVSLLRRAVPGRGAPPRGPGDRAGDAARVLPRHGGHRRGGLARRDPVAPERPADRAGKLRFERGDRAIPASSDAEAARRRTNPSAAREARRGCRRSAKRRARAAAHVMLTLWRPAPALRRSALQADFAASRCVPSAGVGRSRQAAIGRALETPTRGRPHHRNLASFLGSDLVD